MKVAKGLQVLIYEDLVNYNTICPKFLVSIVYCNNIVYIVFFTISNQNKRISKINLKWVIT